MTAILGLSCYFHDAAACVLRDGVVVAAVAEERLNREKHSAGFPERAIDYVLRAARVNPGQLDGIAFYEKPFWKCDRLLTSIVGTWPRSRGLFVSAMPDWVHRKLRIEDTLGDFLGATPPLYYCDHHHSHAALAFFQSGFEEAALLTLDGVGEWATATLGRGAGLVVELPLEMRFPHSLGLLYSALTTYLGFEANDAEWKVMGLAPYGSPRYVDRIGELATVLPDGSIAVRMRCFTYHASDRRMFNDRTARILGRPPRAPDEELEDFHKDVAASLQVVVEDSMARLVRTLHERFPSENVCLSGGVFLNSVANGRLLPRGPFARWYIPCAPGDDGGAIGAALAVHHEILGNARGPRSDSACFGPSFTPGEIEAYLRARELPYSEMPEERAADRVAELLCGGSVVGFFQGRAEFGPRALGNRSILADPRAPDMKDRINRKIKYREFFRPFAPVVIAERAEEFFDVRAPSPFMSHVWPVRPAHAARLPAITHCDGSARVQTLLPEENPALHGVLVAFSRRTGYPVLLNTSFNRAREPIVTTPHDAVECFLGTGMDALAIGPFLLVKNTRGELS